MTLGKLLELYVNGALSIKYNKGDCVATIGSVAITEEQGAVLCKQLGWTDYYLHPFEIIDKTSKFIRAFKSGIIEVDKLNTTTVEFRNTRSNVYGKTFDRIHIEHKEFSMSILYGMAGNESPYVIYDSPSSIPLKRCRNMKQVVEFINTKY